MFHRFFLPLGLFAVLLAACQPITTTTPPPAVATSAPNIIVPTGTSGPPPHADAIRFALIGDTALTNVWTYYDEPGTDYNNRAVQAGFWPSLYRLSPITGAFEPFLAGGNFSLLEPDSGYFASNVTLRSGLLWSDGTPLTAADVAFTVNTALTFHLGLDWAAAYDPNVIYRADVTGPLTVRFYFRVQPTIEDWQYGALQGPILNAAYWQPKLAAATSMLLPNPDLDNAILNLQNEAAGLQSELNDLLYQLSITDSASKAFEALQVQITDKQEEINAVNKHIQDKQDEKEAVFAAARQVLYALDASGEPTFGPFRPSLRGTHEFENAVNPYYPFEVPNFDRAIYLVYPDETSAVKALTSGDVNVILARDGIAAPENVSQSPAGGIAPTISQFPRSNLRLLAFNLTNPPLSETNLRQAIVCMATQHFFSTNVYYPDSLIPSKNGFGYTDTAPFPCAGLDAQARLEYVIRQLESAGYAWAVKPTWDGAARAGSGLRRGGTNVPSFTILVAQEDPFRLATASAIADQLKILGIDAHVEEADVSDVLYRVFDSRQFDMVILGWRLPRYPSYLCDLFGSDNPYFYGRAEMTMHCTSFHSALDLEAAQQETFVIQMLLAGDVPVAPLYAEVGYDAYAGVAYPFAEVLDGIAGMYGAPGLAIPAIP